MMALWQKRLWSYIKSRKQDSTGIGPLTYQGSTYTDSKIKVMSLLIIFHLCLHLTTPQSYLM